MNFEKIIRENRVLFHEKMFHACEVHFLMELHVCDIVFRC